LVGVSALALAAVPETASAQDTATTTGQPGDSETPPSPPKDETTSDEIVITGIRASLRESMDIKRNAYGVVDAISAEDIGKFPDTNLAESLQRITGVSIQRDNGEGSFVTVRGFGPEFNLVTLNGRQMPTSSLGDGGSPPSTRSFDFANLASEGIAAVEVYKTGRASVASGGIGSTINIRTPRPLDRPGMRGSVAVKAVWDSSSEGDVTPTPEISGIFSDTFADGRVGILVTGVYQKRKAAVNQANVGWRDGYLGSENNWGSLAQPGDPRFDNIINRPGPTDVYEVPQNASYDLNEIDRKRLNGQLVLQFRPTDTLTGTLDYTYSRNTVEVRNSNVGIWFNHGDTSSEWTDGPVAGPVFYTERFGPGKDLSYSGSLTANRSENKSLGGNISWNAFDALTLSLDAHHSTAVSKPTNDFGTSISVGNAVFGVGDQTINFDEDLPVISYNMLPGINALDRSLITPTGNAFRNAYFKDRINQGQLIGRYDFDTSFLDSVDFGVSYIDNKIRSAFGFIQNDTWGGAGPASDIPDDIFQIASLPDRFDGVSGSNDPNMIQSFYTFDFERMVDLIEGLYGTCSNPLTGSAIAGTCLAQFTVDRRTTEKTWAPYLQLNNAFDLFSNPAHIVAGLRYEKTKVTSSALVPVPSGTRWVADNEFSVIYSGDSDFTTFKGDYNHWLPSIDFDVQPIADVKLRASYSHTITRADYASLQGGRTIDSLFRVGGGTGSQGNPGLLPYKSKNIDFSAEWYYGRESYASVGYFHKNVSNFISTTQIGTDAFDLRTPVGGPRYTAALAALGPNAGATAIRQYIAANYPDTVEIQSNGQIFVLALPEDPLVNFQITTPFNSDQKAKLYGWEFAVQHSFWNTGIGAILNYTIVKGDAKYDNTQPWSVPQFALTGLSDSANAVLFYDKNGLQARVAYNWRDEYLAGTGPNPFYIEAYGQVDASASWEFKPGMEVFGEVINLTGEGRRGHRRSDRNVTFASPGFARYAAGLRFTF
jgi:TonB-dependent receptor